MIDVQRHTSSFTDTIVCTLLEAFQRRLPLNVCTPEQLESYLNSCGCLRRDQFFAVTTEIPAIRSQGTLLCWPTPVPSRYPENNRVWAKVFWAGNDRQRFRAPTVILLRALMSTGEFGYRRIAARFNARGWNAVLVELPYHSRRRPPGMPNGALALTADLPHNGETLRQAVIEVRELMAWFRAQGCPEFGLIGTSYGGWIGALVSFLEVDFRFITLLQPVTDIEHILWQSPAGSAVRRMLIQAGIKPGATSRHAHLTSPLHGRPLVPPDRVLIIGGAHDRITPPGVLQELVRRWGGVRYAEVNQGHFGYAAMAKALEVSLSHCGHGARVHTAEHGDHGGKTKSEAPA
jgi:pimeloyl-ACP methyl ester carboxylesterase